MNGANKDPPISQRLEQQVLSRREAGQPRIPAVNFRLRSVDDG